MTRIAFLLESLDAAKGGLETATRDFMMTLAGKGHEVHVFAPEKERPLAGALRFHGVKVGGIGRAARVRSFARSAAETVNREDFDVVHGVGWTWSQDVFQPHGGVYEAARKAKERTEPPRSALSMRLRRAFNLRQKAFEETARKQYEQNPAEVFVALSEMVRRDMCDFHHVPDDRIEVVYNGVDTERFHPGNRELHRTPVRKQYGIGEDEVVFLIIAHNFRLKGVPGLVKCVTEKDFPACRLLVAGRDRLQTRLAGLAESRAPGRVIFTGAVSDTVPCYAAADVYVHPTWYDPCSLVVLEALASGLPVITSTMNGAGELMTQGREGYVAAPGDPAGLSDALLRLLDAELREKTGRAARVLAEEHTIEHNYRRMMEVYGKVRRRKA